MNPLYFWPILVLLFCTDCLIAQHNMAINPPEFVAPCGQNYSYTLNISAAQNSSIINGFLTYDLPEGINYVPQSVTGFGVSEFNINSVNQPVFELPAQINGSLTLSFLASSSCSLQGIAGPLNDVVTLQHADGTASFTSPNYNQNTPLIQLVSCTNLTETANVGNSFLRGCQVVNAGFVPISELYLQDIHDISAVSITNSGLGTVISNFPLTIAYTATDFMQIGNGDAFFDPNESIYLEEEVEVLECGNGGSTLLYSWGCNGNICQLFDEIVAQVSPEDNYPEIVITDTEHQLAAPCEAGYLLCEVSNAGAEITPGGGAAFDLVLELGIGISNSILQRDDCLPLSSFALGDNNNINIIEPMEGGYQIDCQQFTSDPDGVGGLDDLDGDGQFDDLAVGESINLYSLVTWGENCYEGLCPNTFPERTMRFKSYFLGQCDDTPISSSEAIADYTYAVSLDEVEYNVTSFDNVITIDIRTDGALTGFSEVCPDAQTVLTLILPSTIQIPPTFDPQFDEQSIPWSVAEDTIFLNAPASGYEGVFHLVLDGFCPPAIPPVNIEAPCAGISQSSGGGNFNYSIKYQLTYQCNPNCNDNMLLYCEETPTIELACTNENMGIGGSISTMSGTRLSLGWTDETLTQKVSNTAPDIDLKRAMSGDTVQFVLQGGFTGQGSFDTTLLRLEHLIGANNAPYFLFNGGTLRLQDIETGDQIDCPISNWDDEMTVDFYYQNDYSLYDLLKPNGCWDGYHLTEGDIVTFTANYVVQESVPDNAIMVNMRGKFIFNYQGESYDCGEALAAMSLINPRRGIYFDHVYSNIGCDTIEFKTVFEQGVSAPSDDFFPFEYRPTFRWDSLVYHLPEWMTFVENSATYEYEYRENGLPDDDIELATVLLNTPTVLTTGTQKQFIFGNTEPLPLTDFLSEGTRSILTFRAIPHCLNTEQLDYTIDQYYTYNYYNEGNREETYETKDRQVNYEATNVVLNVVNPIFPGLSDTASWAFEYCYGGLHSDFVPNNWFLIDLNTPTITPYALLEFLPDGTTINHPILPVGNGEDYWIQIGDMAANTCRDFELQALFATCEDMEFQLLSNFACDGYPADPFTPEYTCNNSQSSVNLLLLTQLAALQINLSEAPDFPVPLCENMDFELRIINGGLGGGLAPLVSVVLPSITGSYVSGSSQLAIGSNAFIPIDDPIVNPLTGESYWDISDDIYALAGLEYNPQNEFRIRFSLFTDCSYDPQSAFSYWVEWRDVCGNNETTPEFFALPFELIGAPENMNEYLLDLQSDPIEACAAQNDVFVQLEYLGGATDNVTSDTERIRIVLPEGLTYLANSFQANNNITPSEPAIYVENSERILEWPMPANLPQGSSIDFQIGIVADAPENLNCNTIPIRLTTLALGDIPCATEVGGFCSIDYFETTFETTTTIDKAIYALTLNNLQTENAAPEGEAWTFDINLQNNSAVNAGENIHLDFYLDDGDGIFDINTDPYADFLDYDASGLGAAAIDVVSYDLFVPAIQTCDGIFVHLALENNGCTCIETSAYLAPPILLNTSSDTLLCQENTITIGSPSIEGYSYEWLTPDYLSHPFSAQTDFSFTENMNGNTITETLILQTTRAGGCLTFDTIYATIFDVEIDLNIVQEIPCFGDELGEIAANITGGTGDYVVEWSNTTETSLSQLNLPVGDYQLTAADTLGCTDTTNILLTEPPLLELNVTTEDVICPSGNNGSIQTEILGGAPLYTTTWSNNINNNTSENLVAGSYALTITDANNCTLDSTIIITQPPPLVIELEAETISCPEEMDGSIYVLTPDAPGYLYSLDGANYQPSPIFNGLGLGDYTVYIQDELDCLFEENAILENPFDQLLQVPQDIRVHLGDSVFLTPYIHPSVTQIEWTPSTWLSCDTCATAWSSPLRHFNYTITVISEGGCIETDKFNVFVDADIYAPNAFSPNFDGMNDHFTLFSYSGSTHINKLEIFDRWGNLVFMNEDFSTNQSSDGWDGSFKGKELPAGVYIYQAEVTQLNGRTFNVSGDISLVR